MGIVDIELGNYGSAAETLRKVADNLPSSVRAKLWAARAAMRAGSLDKAEQLYNDLFRTAKDHPGARAGRALVRLQRGRLEGAADDIFKFDDFAKKYPKEISDKDRALVEYARSEVFHATDNLNVAEGAYQMAVRLDPQNADFPYGLGRNLLQNGRAKEALEPLKKAVEKEPNRRAFLIALADAETLVGDADMLMVKPALAYLDVIAALRARYPHPIAAYNVSGELAMVEAAARAGWIDRQRTILETLTSIRRAGADQILTYWATEAAEWLG
jgi:tetratricopeptide (TPR) repeat protein